MSRCSSAKVFGGSGTPSGVCTVARRSAALRRIGLKLRMPSRAKVGLYPVHNSRAFPHQTVALAVRPFGVLFGNRGHARHAAMAPFATQPPQKPALQQLGVEPVGFRSPMLPRYRDTRGMDHVSLYSTRRKPARQPEAVAASFEGKRNPRDRAADPDRLILPAMQQGKQPVWARIELLARLTLNAGKHAGNQPARLAHLDDGYDRAILVQGDEGSAQVIRLGHCGTPSIKMQRRSCHFLVPLAGAWLDCRKLARRADPSGATVPFPVLEAPRRDMCPGGLATADAP